MSAPAGQADVRARLEASVRASEREFGRSLDCLQRSLRSALVPTDQLREHAGLWALGAFLVGLAAGSRRGGPGIE